MITGTRNFSASEDCVFESILSSTEPPPLPLSLVRGRREMGGNAACLFLERY